MKKKLSKSEAAFIDKIASLYIATGKAKCLGVDMAENPSATVAVLLIPISLPKPNRDEMSFSA